MATFSDGPDDFNMADPISISSAGDMRMHLQLLLDSKEKQLQHAGTLGQRVLAQQMELEERIRQLHDIDIDKADDDEVGAEMRLRYRDLANTLSAWDEENVQLSSAFGSRRLVNGIHPSPTLPNSDLPPDDASHPSTGPTPAQSSRRAKNAAHRANDVEFAFEIGSSLLTEVRRLQSLLGERDKAIQDMKEEKDDLEKAVEGLRSALRTQEQSADKFKEENWNLEVTLQDLRTQLSDAQSGSQRHEAESKRLTRLLNAAREAGDTHKTDAERLKGTLEDLKARHETDVAQARKHAAGLARDKSDLQQALDSYKAEVARAGRRMPRFGSPLTPGAGSVADARTPAPEDEDGDDPFSVGGASTNRRKDTSTLFPPDVFGSEYADSSPEPSPSRPFLSPSHPSNEIEILQQKLAHAQRQISTLKGTLQREKELRMEYRRRLTGGDGGSGEEDDFDGGVGEEEKEELVVVERKPRPKARGTPFRSGRGRGGLKNGGRLTLAQKLGMAVGSPSSEYSFSEQHLDGDSNLLDVPSTAHPPETPSPDPDHVGQQYSFEMAEDDDDDAEEEQGFGGGAARRSPSPPPAASNRASIDGTMDPAFANVLKRSPSNGGAAPHRASPLRQSVVARTRLRESAGRGGSVGRRRGGAAFQAPRPASLVGMPEALAAELGLGVDADADVDADRGVGMASVLEDEVEGADETVGRREVRGFACQTDDGVVVEMALPLPSPTIRVTSDMGVQVEPAPTPVPELVVIPPVVKSDAMSQTEVVVVPPVVKSDAMAQTEVVECAEMSVETDPVPVPAKPILVDTATWVDADILVRTHEAAAQTLRAQAVDFGAQTTPVLEPAFVLAEPKMPVRAQTPPPSSPVFTPSAQTTPRRTTLTQSDYSSLRNLSGDTTILGPSAVIARLRGAREMDEEDEGEMTETGAETETDLDDYHDARAGMGSTPTPSESLDDFHSMSTMTDNEYPDSSDDESDGESIKASKISLNRKSPSSASSFNDIGSSAGLSKSTSTYESQATETEPIEEPPLPPTRDLKESAMQTDEWVPPAPPAPAPVVVPAPVPPLVPVATVTTPAGFNLYRVGSNGQPFQFVSPPTAVSPMTAVTPVPIPSRLPSQLSSSSSQRDSNATLGVRQTRFSTSSLASDKRQSIESALSSSNVEGTRAHTPSLGSAGSPTVDKTRPPIMALPPPPRMPPPPNAMPPPNFIPEHRRPASAASWHRGEGPPPRPTSPPPAELIQRATTPTFGAVLTVPGRGSIRQHGSSLPPMNQGLRQPPSTNSFRSAANAASHAQHSQGSTLATHGSGVALGDPRGRHLRSTASLLSEEEVASRRSSISSDHFQGHARNGTNAGGATVPITPNNKANTSMGVGGSTDPQIIHAITQTMIGEFLYKYTRKAIGKGHGERRHKRFFWVHPYTKTLYWSSADPGSSNVSESSAKSAYIDSVRSVLDPNPMPPGLYQYSVVIATPQREMKITAPTKERHDIWLHALQYLLSRPSPAPITSPGTLNGAPPTTPPAHTGEDGVMMTKGMVASPQSQRSALSAHTAMTGESAWNVTPRGQRSHSQLSIGGSVSKRSGTPAAEYLRWADGPGSPSIHSGFEHIPGAGADDDDDDLDFEIHDASLQDDGFEGLENVRACCDGRHTVGRSGLNHQHHHHQHHQHPHHHDHPAQHDRLTSESLQPARPVSPAWSFRSRASSTRSRSQDGGAGNLFSRFGSRRSARPSTGPTQE